MGDVFRAQERAARQMRLASARRAAAANEGGLAHCSGPVGSVERIRRDLIDPDTGEVLSHDVWQASFDQQKRLVPDPDEGRAWIRARRAAWERDVLPKRRARVAASEALRVLDEIEIEDPDLSRARRALATFLS